MVALRQRRRHAFIGPASLFYKIRGAPPPEVYRGNHGRWYEFSHTPAVDPRHAHRHAEHRKWA